MEDLKSKRTIAITLAAIVLCGAMVAVELFKKTKATRTNNALSYLEQKGFINNDELDSVLFDTNKIFKHYNSNGVEEVFIKVDGNDNISKIISKYKEQGKKVGIIVSPYDTTYDALYRTIDNIKKAISDHGIDLPIYYNIDKLSLNTKNKELNLELSEKFCRKLEANGAYVGIFGKDESLTKYHQFYSEYYDKETLPYDVMVLMDSEEINYPGVYNAVALDNGEVLTKNLEVVSSFNKPESFVDDFKYTIQPGDTLLSIAEKFNMTIKDLERYNNIVNRNILIAGKTIIIPNSYPIKEKETKKEVVYTVKSGDNLTIIANKFGISTNELQTYNNIKDANKIGIGQQLTIPGVYSRELLKGIDVSRYQGNINWEKVSSQIDFAILRVMNTEVNTYDSKFHDNIKECEKLNIPVGVYWWSNATTKEEIKQEIKLVVEQLSAYSIECPVYIDVEGKKMLNLSNDELRDVLNEGCIELASLGYTPGIYINQNRIEAIKGLEWNVWSTNSKTYNTPTNFSDFKKDDFYIEGYQLEEDSNITSRQYCQVGTVDGIDGYVDLDYALSSIINSKEKNNKLTKKQ